MRTRIEEKEVFSEMSRQALAGRTAATETPPFWLFTVILPLDVSAFRAPAMLLNSRFPKESRTVTELPDRELPETRPLLVVQLTRPFTSEKVTFPKLSVISTAPPIEETSTLPLLSCTIKSPRILRASTLPNELLSRAEPVSRTLSEPWLLSNSLLLRTPAAFTLPKLFFTNSGASDGIAMS